MKREAPYDFTRRMLSAGEIDYNLIEYNLEGRLHSVTDDETYFESASKAIAAHKFQVMEGDWDIPMTTYHQRAVRLGHKISQLSAYKH